MDPIPEDYPLAGLCCIEKYICDRRTVAVRRGNSVFRTSVNVYRERKEPPNTVRTMWKDFVRQFRPVQHSPQHHGFQGCLGWGLPPMTDLPAKRRKLACALA
ncbi:hypothetical protein TNCV_4108771 [Trichonephila clavipes]|nr:hypothetical protein TNCV_4108771 [Trichonephila clavipes]